MRTALALTLASLLSACSLFGTAEAPRSTATSDPPVDAAGPLSFEDRLRRFFCPSDPAGCEIENIADAAFDYPGWIRKSVASDALTGVRPQTSAVYTVKPASKAQIFSLGFVRYQRLDDTADIPPTKRSSGVFKDNKVLVKYKIVSENNTVLAVFTRDFDQNVEDFLATL